MNKQINSYLTLILIIFSCSEDSAIIISNTPTNLPSQNYKINLHSNSGSFLETVTIYWNGIEGEIELMSSNIPINSSGNSHTFSEMTPGEFRDITIQAVTDDFTYVDSIQIFTRPVYPVSNFRYEVEMVMRGNNIWDEGEYFTDLDSNNIWNVGEEFIDIEYPKYHRVLNWSPTIEPDETFSNYILYRSDNDNVDILINPENCACEIATLTKSDTSFTDSMVAEKSSIFDYYYQIRVSSGSYGRNSYIYNYTNFTPPSKIPLLEANVSKNNSDFIQLTWDAVSVSTYLYQYEIWRISDTNADDLLKMAIILDPNQGKFMDRNVGNGTSYNYSVALVHINGNRVFSDYVTGWSTP
jgi:hypothetical protein